MMLINSRLLIYCYIKNIFHQNIFLKKASEQNEKIKRQQSKRGWFYGKFLNFNDHSSYEEINNPSFEADKEIDESAVRPISSLEKVQSASARYQHVIAKENKKKEVNCKYEKMTKTLLLK